MKKLWGKKMQKKKKRGRRRKMQRGGVYRRRRLGFGEPGIYQGGGQKGAGLLTPFIDLLGSIL